LRASVNFLIAANCRFVGFVVSPFCMTAPADKYKHGLICLDGTEAVNGILDVRSLAALHVYLQQ